MNCVNYCEHQFPCTTSHTTFVDVNVEDMDERTALHIAANAGATDVVSSLLMAKPNLDKVNRQ